MYGFFGTPSFGSIWYWVLSVLVWVLVTHRTMGVPYDMLLSGKRSPEVAARVDELAHITSLRLCLLKEHHGIWIAAIVGCGLSSLYAIGFGIGFELGKAAFVLVLPLAIIAYSTLRTAISIQNGNFRGQVLIRVLSRRHFWHQVIAVVSMFCAVAVALANRPVVAF